MSYINGVFRITEELIRIVNKLKKLIAKTLLYVVLVESDEFLCQTFDLIWTKNGKFAQKTKCGTQFRVRRWPMSQWHEKLIDYRIITTSILTCATHGLLS